MLSGCPSLVGPPWKRWYSNRRNDLGLEGDGHNWKENHGVTPTIFAAEGCDNHPDLLDAVPSRACINDTHLGRGGSSRIGRFVISIWEDLRLMGGEHPCSWIRFCCDFRGGCMIQASHSRVANRFCLGGLCHVGNKEIYVEDALSDIGRKGPDPLRAPSHSCHRS